MLKPGIVSIAQLDRPLTMFGSKKHASLLLLGALTAQGSQDAPDYDAVLSHVLTANGTWKSTARERFALLDAELLAVLKERVPRGQRLDVLDLGVSSGITSVRLFELLKRSYAVRFVATDLMRDAVAVRAPAGWAVVFDARGNPLQYVIGPFVLQGQGYEPVFYPINRLLRRWARWRLLPQAEAVLKRFDPTAAADFEPVRIDGFEVTRIPLLASETLRAQAQDPDFHFELANILEPIEHRADVIRAMNVLMPVYFDATRLAAAIRNCANALEPGGLLVLGRSPTNEPQDVKATIYVKDGERLQPVRRLNGGYEAEDLVQEDARAGAPRRASGDASASSR